MKLTDIAHIHSGTAFTKKPVFNELGEFYVLGGSAVSGDIILTDKIIKVSRLQPGLKMPQQDIKTGDILLRSKGANRVAVVFDWPGQDLAVFPSSLFHVIRVNDVYRFNPYFIAMVINSNFVQSYLEDNAKGSTIMHFPLSVTKEIEIPEVPASNQSIVVQLGDVFSRQKNLMHELSTAKLSYQAACINEQIWGRKK